MRGGGGIRIPMYFSFRSSSLSALGHVKIYEIYKTYPLTIFKKLELEIDFHFILLSESADVQKSGKAAFGRKNKGPEVVLERVKERIYSVTRFSTHINRIFALPHQKTEKLSKIWTGFIFQI